MKILIVHRFFVFVLALIFSIQCFAANAPIEITQDKHLGKITLITIKNHLTEDAEIHFFGKKATLENFSFIDNDAYSTIKAKTSCSYIIKDNNNDNANHTSNPEET